MVAELIDGRHKGRGECVPYRRYGETMAGVTRALSEMCDKLALGFDRCALQQAMPPGAARNALDCAFWDLEAKRAGTPAHALAGHPRAATAHHRLHHHAQHARGHGRRRRAASRPASFSR